MKRGFGAESLPIVKAIKLHQAKSDKPTPLVFHIHGGGWMGGDKNNPSGLKSYLDAGFLVVGGTDSPVCGVYRCFS